MPPSSLIKINIWFYGMEHLYFALDLSRALLFTFLSVSFCQVLTHTQTHTDSFRTFGSILFLSFVLFVSSFILFCFVRKSITSFTWRANIGISHTFCLSITFSVSVQLFLFINSYTSQRQQDVTLIYENVTHIKSVPIKCKCKQTIIMMIIKCQKWS